MDSQTFALPGQVLGSASKYTPGNGTHLHASQICASIAGTITTTSSSTSKTLSITRLPSSPTQPTIARLPSVSSVVLARVTRTTPRQATLSLLVIDNVPVSLSASNDSHFTGIIRAQDVRATEKDRVKIGESFAPGDIVRAKVVSLGDQGGYYCSTASNELGVVVGRSGNGVEMRAVSWKEMVEVGGAGARELRKVARP